jgi:hypothetical protein
MGPSLTGAGTHGSGGGASSGDCEDFSTSIHRFVQQGLFNNKVLLADRRVTDRTFAGRTLHKTEMAHLHRWRLAAARAAKHQRRARHQHF